MIKVVRKLIKLVSDKKHAACRCTLSEVLVGERECTLSSLYM